MRKYLLFKSIIILIIYYVSTFVISFTLIVQYVVNNNHISLAKYINVKELKNNFYEDINEYSSNLINLKNNNINIKSESFEFTGELTTNFLKKTFSKISNNISADFSNPEIMLYFYFNSSEISTYLNKYFNHLGDYNFQNYLLEKKPKNNKDLKNNKNQKESDNNKKEVKENNDQKLNKTISKIINRIKSTDYFFLISPIHFKLEVKHQNIPFILILKFNGYKWKVQNIIIPYKKLLDPKNISLSN